MNDKIFVAQANLTFGKYSVRKGQSISEAEYNNLPAKYKIKFKVGKPGLPSAGLNEIIGDTPEEKQKRIELNSEAKELQALLKEADKNISELEKELAKAGKDVEELTKKLNDQEKVDEDLKKQNAELTAKVSELEKELAKVKKK